MTPTDTQLEIPLAPIDDQLDDTPEAPLVPTSLRLPSDKQMPPIIRQILSVAPPSRKIASFIAAVSPLCALAPRIRLHYWHDAPQHLTALLLQVVIEAPQSGGKSFATDIADLIIKPTLKQREEHLRRLEQEYREKKRRRSANKELEEEPHVTICVIPPNISKTVITKRADYAKRFLGDYLTFWMFSDELAQLTDAGKNGYSDLRTIMRAAYDLGSEFGTDFASDNSYSCMADINICAMFCATPSAIDEYYNAKSIEGGNITRCILCPIQDSLETGADRFKAYTPEQIEEIHHYLDQLMANIYTPDGRLQPTRMLDMQWLDRDCIAFCDRSLAEFKLSGRESQRTFYKRSSVSAFRIASLCYYLYGFDPKVTESRRRHYCRLIFNYMAEYIMSNMVRRWGKQFDELNAKRRGKTYDSGRPPRLFDLLPDTFTREQLRIQIEQLHLATDVRHFLSIWKHDQLIERIDKNNFRKLQTHTPNATS